MTNARQTVVGVGLATLIVGAWSILHVAAVFQPGWLPDRLQSPWMGGLAVVLLTWLSVGLFIVAHDAMHGTLSPAKPRLGHAIGALALALYAGFSYRRLLPAHHCHHAAPGTHDDPDFAAPQQASLGRWFARFMLSYFGTRELLWMVARVGAYFALGAELTHILLFFALPGLLSAFQLFYFGTYLPHRPIHGQPFMDAHRARSNAYARWLSLLSCFHFGYHHEHHLRPDLPWWRLPACRAGEAS